MTWSPIHLQIEAHKNDIKAVSFDSKRSLIATASRDGTIKLWKDFTQNGHELSLHEGFVNSVAFCDDYLCSGGNDNLISVWSLESSAPVGLLIAHEGNVCKLTQLPANCAPFVLASASWDGSARLWTAEWNPASSLVLKDAASTGPCWSICSLGPETFITGHGDCSLKWWRSDSLFRTTPKAHTDVVRDLCAFGGGRFFASVGNDGALKIWDPESGRPIVNKSDAHPAFIYAVASYPADNENVLLATAGEEGYVKVWRFNCLSKELLLESELRVPMLSAWTVAFTSTGELLVAGSGGSLFVFAQDKSDPATQQRFDSLLSVFEFSACKQEELERTAKDASILLNPGSHTGQNVIVKSAESGRFEAHQWSGSEWISLGEVVSHAPPSKTTSFEGKEYDYVFKVELDDEGRTYQLPYNRGQNPYAVSKEFLERNDLPISYLDQVAAFIFQNAGADAQVRPEEPEKKADSMVTFTVFNEAGISSKLREFGMTLPISVEAVQKALQEWPVDRLFPLIDWLRVQVLSRDVSFDSIPFDRIVAAQSSATSKAEQAALTMALRFYCNWLSKADNDSRLSKGEDLVGVVGATTSNLTKNTTWFSLLLSLLNNMAIKGVQLDSIAALTIGVLNESKGIACSPEDLNCLRNILTATPDSSLKATLKTLIDSL